MWFKVLRQILYRESGIYSVSTYCDVINGEKYSILLVVSYLIWTFVPHGTRKELALVKDS